MHLIRLSNLLCSRMEKQQQQCSDTSECSKAKAVLSKMQSHQHMYLHRAPRLPSPSAWGRTKDNHGSRYGQHFVRLRTRTTCLCTVAANKTVKQDASVQLPTSHVLPYATLKRFQCRLAWWQHSNLPADFVWVVATSFLFMLWIYSVLSEHWTAISELIVCRFFGGPIKTHISPFHTSTARP